MQSTQNGLADNPAIGLSRAMNGSVFVQRHVRSVGVVILDVFGQYTCQMLFVQDDDMVQAFPPERSHDPFGDWILPGTSGGRRRVFQSEAFYRLFEFVAEDSIVITDDILSGFIKGKGLTKLLYGPLRVWL